MIGVTGTSEQAAKARAEFEAAKAQLERRREVAASVTDEDRARLSQLEGTTNQEGSIAAMIKGLAELVKAAEDAVKAANVAAAERDRVVAGAQTETEGSVNAFEIGRQTRGVGTAARVRTAQEQERERREAETARARQRQQAEAARREGLGREGEGIADGVARGASDPRQSAALEQIGNRIAADPAGGGLDQLTSAIERLLTTADQTRARELRRALERIERLEAKVKKGGDNP